MSDQNLLEINDQIKRHAIAIENWPHRERAAFLHAWADRFNTELSLEIVTPAIQIEPLRRRALGTYRRSLNGFGLAHEITFNERYLDRPIADVLRTCLHELLHEWQELHGKPTASGSGNYHNAEYRNKAKEFGLIVDDHGRSRGIEPGAFTQLLETHGIPFSSNEPVQSVAPKGNGSKLVKWSCRCTNVRAAVELEAGCLRCGEIFKRAAASW